MTVAIRFENVSKQYRLGEVGSGTLADDLHRLWAKMLGKPDPLAMVGQVNDREARLEKPTKKGTRIWLGSPGTNPSSVDYVWALRNIGFDVGEGEIIGVIGRNGAGKSTLLKILSRVTAPTTGSIKTKGRIASLLEVGTGFHPELTGRENIFLNGAVLGMRRQEISKQLDAIIDFSGCGKYVDTPVKRYSSGMTVRLGFAVAAHLECEILVVDEVLAVGDAEFQRKCIGKMKSVTSLEGRTVIFVSHNMAAVQSLCENSIVLRKGTCSAKLPTKEAISTYLAKDRITETLHTLDISDRIGNGFVQVSVNQPNGNASAKEFTASEDIEITAKISTEYDRVNLAIRICNQSGECIYHLSDEYAAISHMGTIRKLTVAPFALAPGRYSISFTLFMRNYRVIQSLDDALQISIADIESDNLQLTQAKFLGVSHPAYGKWAEYKNTK